MSLRIAFDLDGVLADMSAALDRETRASAPSGGPDDDTSEPTGRNGRPRRPDSRALWRTVQAIENFWESLDELRPGAIARLYRIASARGWEVLFITTRPDTAGATVQRQTQRWLARHGFPMPSVYVVKGSRGAVAKALDLDVVVDDRPENCLDVATESGARAILVWNDAGSARPRSPRPDRTALNLGIGVVNSVDQCLDLLAGLESGINGPANAPRASLLERLRMRLGLEEPRGPREAAEQTMTG